MFKANFQNFIYFLGRLAPMMLVFFFVFISIINQDWRGIIFLAGVLIACFFAILLSNTFENKFAEDISMGMCSFTDKQFSKFPLSSVVLGYSIMYLFFPMMKIYGGVTNPYVFITLLIFVCVDILFLTSNRCSVLNTGGADIFNLGIPISISYAVGAFIAHILVVLLMSTDNDKLLYFGKDSSNPLCKVNNTSKNFTCKVYKNGELITTS
jgi:hypothetical protein